MSLRAAIALTLFGSLLMGLSWVLQKQAARRLPAIGTAPPVATARAFLGSARWRSGVTLMGAGFLCFQTAVARSGEISILQPMFGAGLVVLAVWAVVFLEERFSGFEWAALVLLAAAIAGLGATAEPHRPTLAPAGLVAAPLGVAAAGAVWCLAPGLRRGLSPELALGAGGGVVQGLGLVLMGAYSVLDRTGGPGWRVLLVPCAAACFLVSFVTMQRGVQVGRALVVVTVNTVLTNLVAIAGGIAILGEHLPEDPRRRALQVAALATFVVASGVLARVGVAAGAAPLATPDAGAARRPA